MGLSCILCLLFLKCYVFGIENFDCFNGYRLRSVPSSCTVLFSDASHIGFGGYDNINKTPAKAFTLPAKRKWAQGQAGL